jgi:hypothetical protein
MDIFSRLKMGSFERTFQFWEKKKSRRTISVEYGMCWSVGIRFRLRTGGRKLLCVPVRCLGAKSNHNSTNLVSVFPNLLKLEYRIVGPPSVLTRVLPFATFLSVFIVTGWPNLVLLTKHHAIRTYWGNGVKAPCILDLGTRWVWVVRFTPRLLYPQVNSPWYPLDMRLCGPHSRSGHGGEEKNSQLPPTITVCAVRQILLGWWNQRWVI